MKVVCMPSLVWMCIRPNAARSVCGAHCLRRCRGWNCSGHLRLRDGAPPAIPCQIVPRLAPIVVSGFGRKIGEELQYQKGARSGTRASAP